MDILHFYKLFSKNKEIIFLDYFIFKTAVEWNSRAKFMTLHQKKRILDAFFALTEQNPTKVLFTADISKTADLSSDEGNL